MPRANCICDNHGQTTSTCMPQSGQTVHVLHHGRGVPDEIINVEISMVYDYITSSQPIDKS